MYPRLIELEKKDDESIQTNVPQSGNYLGRNVVSNAVVRSKENLHNSSNRNREFLPNFLLENGLICVNTKFQKRKRKLWTYTYASNAKAQIDYTLMNKKWINSILNSEPYSSFEGVSSNHRIVTSEPMQEYDFTIRLFSVISGILVAGSYPFADMQSVYSTALADWAIQRVKCQTVLFQIVQFNISTDFRGQNSSISSIQFSISTQFKCQNSSILNNSV